MEFISYPGQMSTLPAPLDVLARAQRGVVTLSQVDRLGVERSLIGRLAVEGSALQLAPGAYKLGASTSRTDQVLAHWLLLAGVDLPGPIDPTPSLVASHETAAYLFEVLPTPDVWTFTGRAADYPSVAGACLIAAEVPSNGITTVDGIPTTTFPRTVADLVAARADLDVLAHAVEFGLDAGLADADEVALALTPVRDQYGVRDDVSVIDFVITEGGG